MTPATIPSYFYRGQSSSGAGGGGAGGAREDDLPAEYLSSALAKQKQVSTDRYQYL